MKAEKIKNIQKIAQAINNFNECYKDCGKLYSNVNGDIPAEKFLEFLIENPHLQQIANEIIKLNKELSYVSKNRIIPR